jgi:broad specificity phosphatase PhoE
VVKDGVCLCCVGTLVVKDRACFSVLVLCRYPSGESYMDVIQRLEPVITEIERERECVCIVAHQAVLRIIIGYFTATPLEAITGAVW